MSWDCRPSGGLCLSVRSDPVLVPLHPRCPGGTGAAEPSQRVGEDETRHSAAQDRDDERHVWRTGERARTTETRAVRRTRFVLGIHTIYSMCTVRFQRNGQQNLLTQRSGNNATFTMTSTNIKVNENKINTHKRTQKPQMQPHSGYVGADSIGHVREKVKRSTEETKAEESFGLTALSSGSQSCSRLDQRDPLGRFCLSMFSDLENYFLWANTTHLVIGVHGFNKTI